jgi:hypothetical protein
MSFWWRLALPVWISLAFFAAGCNNDAFRNRAQEQENGRHAQAMVDAYFRRLTAAAPDYGWSLLHPQARRDAFGDDYAAYEGLARAADWSRFRWSVEDVVADDPALYLVRVRVPGGRAVTPAFLVDHGGPPFRLLLLPSKEDAERMPIDPDVATVAVRMEGFFGSTGIGAPAGG